MEQDRRIPVFLFTGTIARDLIGRAIELVYLSEAAAQEANIPLHIDYDPYFKEVGNGSGAILKGPPIQIADDTPATLLPPPKRHQGKKSKGGLTALLLEAITKASPVVVTHAELTKVAERANYPRRQAKTRLFELRRRKLIIGTARDGYRLADRVGWPAPIPIKVAGTRKNSNNEIILTALRQAYPKGLDRPQMMKLLAKHKRRPEASSVAINWLKVKGQAEARPKEGGGPGHDWFYVQQKETV